MFKLYDTFGFPLDLTNQIVKEEGFTVDQNSVELLMQEQRDRSRASYASSGSTSTGVGSSGGQVMDVFMEWKSENLTNEFVGYFDYSIQAKVVRSTIAEDGVAYVVLDRCPFYGIGGGQVGDQGTLKLKAEKDTAPGSTREYSVIDSLRPYDGCVIVKVVGENLDALAPGNSVIATVAERERERSSVHHTATHLLHSSLRRILSVDAQGQRTGIDARQAGSLVNPDGLRFDFFCPRPLSLEEIQRVEDDVNAAIQTNGAVTTRECSFDEAVASGALAYFE